LSKTSIVLVALVAFAIFNTLLLAVHLLTPAGSYTFGFPGSQTPPQRILAFFEGRSPILAPTSWVLVGGLWIWRGRMKSRWEASGFESDIFQLFVRMKGGATRIKLLNSLSNPKDRFQLAQELGLDWKAVDYQVELLRKHGFVKQWKAYGKVRMYEVTPMGKKLLELLTDLESKPS
jgi:predicted transcriptional regulator